jgi:hypothetical protein
MAENICKPHLLQRTNTMKTQRSINYNMGKRPTEKILLKKICSTSGNKSMKRMLNAVSYYKNAN